MTAGSTCFAAPFVFETLRFRLRMCTLTVLPPYKGAVFHGALDNAFRRLVCPFIRNHCDNCDIQEQCLYMALFHPSPPDGFKDAGKFSNASPPYVLMPSADNRQAYHPGDTLEFSLTLIGRALDALPYFIFAFDQIGRRGLGKERGRYQLHQVQLQRNGKAHVIYDGSDQALRPLPPAGPVKLPKPPESATLALELQTPLRIKQKGKLVTRLEFVSLFRSLAQRLFLLSAFYGQ